MSGQPNINPLDSAKFRQQYLANLSLRAEIDDFNLQANKIFIRTGAPTQPTDTRTTSERLADLYRLRIEVRSKLGEIADGTNADKIVQQLDDEQLRFLSDQLIQIVGDLKPKYRTGILAEVFMPYFLKYMDIYQTTKGVNSGLQQESGDKILLNQQIIMANMASKSDINNIDDAIRELGLSNTNIGKSILQNLRNIEGVLDYLPETMETLNSADNAIVRGQIQTAINNIVKDLPTKQELNVLVRQLTEAQSRMNISGVETILRRIQELTEAGGDIRDEVFVLQQLLEQAKSESSRPIASSSSSSSSSTSLEDFIFRTNLGAEFRYIEPNEIGTKPSKSELDLYLLRLDNIIPSLYYGISETPSKIKQTKAGIKTFLEQADKRIRNELQKVMRDQSVQEAVVVSPSPEIPTKERITAKGIRIGRGLVRPASMPTKRSDVLVPDFDIDYSKGIVPTPRFIPFGKFVIHKAKLDKDIIAIKRPAGSSLQDLPSRRVSRSLGLVIRKMVGGNVATFDELNKLDKDDQEYLHHLASRSNLIDKLNIPTPKKDEDEKDINLFEVLRGQVLAGNDSLDLIKKFKQLILKMSDRDLIPKGQVRELLVLLTQNGY